MKKSIMAQILLVVFIVFTLYGTTISTFASTQSTTTTDTITTVVTTTKTEVYDSTTIFSTIKTETFGTFIPVEKSIETQRTEMITILTTSFYNKTRTSITTICETESIDDITHCEKFVYTTTIPGHHTLSTVIPEIINYSTTITYRARSHILITTFREVTMVDKTEKIETELITLTLTRTYTTQYTEETPEGKVITVIETPEILIGLTEYLYYFLLAIIGTIVAIILASVYRLRGGRHTEAPKRLQRVYKKCQR